MSSMGSVAAAIYSCTTAKPNRRFQAKRAHIRAARGVRQELCQALALEGGVPTLLKSQEFRAGSLSATLN